jgi:hypothetical protein
MNPAPPMPPSAPLGPRNVPPSVPQSVSLMRSLTGPLLLTSLGVLLAIDYSGGITFGRTWPVLLIVFGLCKVAEHMGPRGL